MFYNYDNSKYNLGTDIVDLKRFYAFDESKLDKLANKILCDEEFEVYNLSKNKNLRLAVYFSAKESISKAICTGLSQLGLKNILLRYDELGKPYVLLAREAHKKARDNNIVNIVISISHDGDYVITNALAISE